eukprot:Protomagalhaensia_wolfi_Nauph_80__853@NODE_1493_length_1504_cov_12_022526_g1157_i0_p2_GENE_NODE_1493_length_1504_cov_12_022526_g1157_i0NODE_1493_length_1504_cov_12_022526_g1157_i0_p2_ORF_typecomplete_len229_score42_13DUF2587/PF10759_9/0_065Phage_sheath_1C/PF17482_2/0_073_NODE_1493_length_1504_cov_12_022526_g1157_i0106792
MRVTGKIWTEDQWNAADEKPLVYPVTYLNEIPAIPDFPEAAQAVFLIGPPSKKLKTFVCVCEKPSLGAEPNVQLYAGEGVTVAKPKVVLDDVEVASAMQKVMKKENKIDTPSTVTTALRSIATAIEEEKEIDSDDDNEDCPNNLDEIHERVIGHLNKHLNPYLTDQKLSHPGAEGFTVLGSSSTWDLTDEGINDRVKEVLESRVPPKKREDKRRIYLLSSCLLGLCLW